MEFIKKHKKIIFLGSFVAVLAYGLYTLKQTSEKEEQIRQERKRRRAVLRKRRRAAEKKKQQGSFQKSVDESLKEASMRSDSVLRDNNITAEESRILESITKSINIKYHEKKRNQLTFEAISDIFENSVLLKHKEYELVVKGSRTARRPLLQKNINAYLDQVQRLEEEIDEVFQLGIEAVIGTCNVTGDVFQSSIDYINEREDTNNKIALLHSAMLQKFKTYLKATKILDFPKLKQIFHYKIDCLTKRGQFFSGILKKIKVDENTVQKLPMIINTILNDLIFEEFGVEEEDALPLLASKELLKDIDLHNLILGLEQITQQIMDPYLGRLPGTI